MGTIVEEVERYHEPKDVMYFGMADEAPPSIV